MSATPPQPEPALPPVRIRVYGLIEVTKRGYIVMLCIAVVLLVTLVTLMYVSPTGSAAFRSFPREWRLSLPWVLGAAVLLAALEAVMIFRRFAREEARQRAEASSKPTSRPER